MRRPSTYALLRATPLQWAFRRRAARLLTIVCYHGVEDAGAFARQLDYLGSIGTFVSVGDVEAAVLSGRPLPRGATLLTFDDGERNMLDTAGPMLAARGIPGIVFVIGGLLDTDEPFWWREVEFLAAAGGRTSVVSETAPAALVQALKTIPNHERLRALDELRASSPEQAPRYPHLRRDELPKLEALGLTVGSHTQHHPILDRCTAEEIEADLAACRAVVSAAIGRDDPYLAYPNGDWDERVVAAAGRVGYRLAFQLGARGVDLRSPRRRPEPLAVTRVNVDSAAPVDRLAILVSGLLPAALRGRDRLRGLARRGRGRMRSAAEPV